MTATPAPGSSSDWPDDKRYPEFASFLASSIIVREAAGEERIRWLDQLFSPHRNYPELARIHAGETPQEFAHKLLQVIWEHPEDLKQLLLHLLERYQRAKPYASEEATISRQEGELRKLITPAFQRGMLPDEYLRALIRERLQRRDFDLMITLETFCQLKAEQVEDIEIRLLDAVPYRLRNIPLLQTIPLSLDDSNLTIVSGIEGIGKSMCKVHQRNLLLKRSPSVLVVEPLPSELLPSNHSASHMRYHLIRSLVGRILDVLKRALQSQPGRITTLKSQGTALLARFDALCCIFPTGRLPWSLTHGSNITEEEQVAYEHEVQRLTKEYKEQLKPGPKGESGRPPGEWLKDVYELALNAGFERIYLLVDGFSNQLQLGNVTPSKLPAFLEHLLQYEILWPVPARIHWKFFVRDDVAELLANRLGSNGYVSVRLETWRPELLLLMVEKVLTHHVELFGGSPIKLADLCEANAIEPLNRLIAQAQGTPANCWKLLHTLFTMGATKGTIPINSQLIEEVLKYN